MHFLNQAWRHGNLANTGGPKIIDTTMPLERQMGLLGSLALQFVFCKMHPAV